ncbi:hypothetical protein L914_03894 [Phytophthora nicotianae]|uniref:Calmodulin n=1 Tax=Phytophthora nicotianae TaxID=4792 RepID=W2NXU9_PHYNI|nr:hypothetical protein L914_03894 [Phytophthora nicotianae]
MNPQHYATYNPQQHQQQFYAGAGAYATQSGGMGGQSLHAWVPPSPQEQQFYDMLFAHVDDQRRNAINGQQAVAFFARSHLDKAILREVWSIADSQRRSELSRNEFYVAMRLISMAQRGEQVSAQRFFQLATMQYPLPMMEGVPPPQQQPVQPQAQMHAPQQDFGSVHQQPTGSYALTTDEKSKYDIVFQQYDTDRDGFLMGTEAVALFQMSGLDRNMLRDIWSMADVTQDSKLSVQEFYVAMHLIVCVSKRGLPMPSTLPRELSETAFGSGGSAGMAGLGNQMPAPSTQNGFPVQKQQESVPPPKPEGMSAFDSLSTAEDAPLPSFASSTRSSRTNSFNHADSNATNSHAGGFGEPSVPTPTGSLQGFSAPVAQDFGSFSAPPVPSATSGRDRTNSASSMNSMSSFSGMTPLPPHPPAQQLPQRNLGSNERIQVQNTGFQTPQQTYPGFGAESFGSSAAVPENPFMGDEEEKKVVGQLDQQNEQVVQALASVERKQIAIEMISEKLRDLDELRHELVTLVMKREDLRSATNTTSSSGDNAAEEQTRLAVERSLRSLVENQKQLIQQLQYDIARHEGELEEAILSAKLQQKLSLESRSSLIDAASPPVSTHDSDRAAGGTNTFVPAPLSLDEPNVLPSPVAAPNAPSISAFSPDATDSSGFNAFSNFDSAPRSIASVTPTSVAEVPSGSPFSPTSSPSQNAAANDSFNAFGDFAAPPSADATSPSAGMSDVPGKSPFSPSPSPAAASDSAGFDAFGAAEAPAPVSLPAPAEASPFSPFSPSPSPAAADDNGFGDFNAAQSSTSAATEAPGHSPFSPTPSPAAATSTSTDFSASFDTPAKTDGPESAPFSSPVATETPAFDAFATAPLSNDSAATPASTTVATENLIFSPVAADNSGSNTFGDFGAAPDNTAAASESTAKQNSSENLLFSPPAAASTESTIKQNSSENLLFSPPAAASTSSGLDAFDDYAAPVSNDSATPAPTPDKTTGNSPFSPIASGTNDFNGFGDFNAAPASNDATSSAPDKPADTLDNSPFSPVAKNDSSSGFEAFEDFNAAPASTDSAGASDAPKATNPSGNSPFSPVATDNSGFGDFGDFNSAPAPTASSTETKSAEVSGNSPFSPVSTDNGFGDFGDFNAAPTSTDNAKPTTRKESTDSNAFETFGDFSAAPSSTSDVGNFN